MSKTGALGRLIFLAVVAGVLAAATVIPIVAEGGVSVRDASNSFTALPFSASSLPQRSEILDSSGHLITYVYGVDGGPGATFTGINRQPVGYNQISPNMVKAIVAIEDSRFWQRGALDLKGTARAMVNDLNGNAIQGASTLEQQYVKDVLILQGLGSPQAYQNATADTPGRKINQLRMAVEVAHRMSKRQIVAAYLNDAFYGSGAWGIEAAAETYFHTTAAKLTLTQSADLAGIVEDPSRYDPLVNHQQSLERRDTVLARMMQTGSLPAPAEASAMKEPLTLHQGTVQSGCGASTVGDNGFFCDYVMHAVLQSKQFGSTMSDRAKTLASGGLKIYTTLDPEDQKATANAVNYTMPEWSSAYNEARNVDTEVLVQPGTGRIMGMAENRPYGTGNGQTEVNYAVNSADGGTGYGVQTGSSSKLFTLVTALEQGTPFGYTDSVQHSMTVDGFQNCSGDVLPPWPVVNASKSDEGTYSLYTGTADSINTFYARLEQKVGLCNVVKTASNMGLTTASGQNLLAAHADSDAAFTLGTTGVSPLSMASAYATVASGGRYCAPVALSRVTNSAGKNVPVPQADCHRVLSPDIANAANYILQGVFTWKGATAAGLGPLRGYQMAGKTGTSNVTHGSGTPYAAFAGYNTNLVSYTSVFNPESPTVDTMSGPSACYHSYAGGASCPAEMFGANAPGSTWNLTFQQANLGPMTPFAAVPKSNRLWRMGSGMLNTAPPKPPSTGGATPAAPAAPANPGGPGGPGKGKGGGGTTGNSGAPSPAPTVSTAPSPAPTAPNPPPTNPGGNPPHAGG
ncbi:MAG: penicillin-binding protein [Streptosporangiales bacterium]|nr:penicillin-binding protein [Streptosporangiales bacterium]